MLRNWMFGEWECNVKDFGEDGCPRGMDVCVCSVDHGNEGLKCIPGPFKVGMYTHTTCTTVLFKVIQSTIHVINVNAILGLIKLIFCQKLQYKRYNVELWSCFSMQHVYRMYKIKSLVLVKGSSRH